jgi:Zn-dependent M28 family amino/carboxypeptidase
MPGVGVRDVGFYLRGRLSQTVARVLNRRAPPPRPPAPVEDVLHGPATPLALTRLLEGRSNQARHAALVRWLEARGVPFRRHGFATFEGAGENLVVELGRGDRALVLVAHHDAVPKSPGANDNAVSVAILPSLLERWAAREPRTRVRLLFAACEEVGYLGSRAWVRAHGVADVRGVLSLELPGVGDSVAVWDASDSVPFLDTVRAVLEGLGLRADAGYHVVGRIPIFGSDHRAFATAGVPAYGLTSVPTAEAEALRQFIFRPLRTALRGTRRPRPFDTYHTARDTGATLDPAALERITRVLEAVVALGG